MGVEGMGEDFGPPFFYFLFELIRGLSWLMMKT